MTLWNDWFSVKYARRFVVAMFEHTIFAHSLIFMLRLISASVEAAINATHSKIIMDNDRLTRFYGCSRMFVDIQFINSPRSKCDIGLFLHLNLLRIFQVLARSTRMSSAAGEAQPHLNIVVRIIRVKPFRYLFGGFDDDNSYNAFHYGLYDARAPFPFNLSHKHFIPAFHLISLIVRSSCASYFSKRHSWAHKPPMAARVRRLESNNEVTVSAMRYGQISLSLFVHCVQFSRSISMFSFHSE